MCSSFSVPRDMQFMRREYFNQWYRLSSYFMALITSQLPMICLTCIISSSLMYFLSGQPMQLHRYLLFLGITFLIGIMSSGFGVLMGSRFNVLVKTIIKKLILNIYHVNFLQNALFLGPYILALMLLLASYPAERLDLSMPEYIMVYISFIRYALDGLLVTLLRFDRPDFPCPQTEILCLTSKPKYILKLAGSLKSSYTHAVVGLVGYYLAFTILSFLILKHRLNRTTKTSRNVNIIIKIKYFLRKCFHIKFS